MKRAVARRPVALAAVKIAHPVPTRERNERLVGVSFAFVASTMRHLGRAGLFADTLVQNPPAIFDSLESSDFE
jgi:hypothetical protein